MTEGDQGFKLSDTFKKTYTFILEIVMGAL